MECLLERVTLRSAALVAAWMSVGFAHGVLNTDNLSILGITIDLNVYGFLDRYDQNWAPNHIDDEKRYAFGRQPEMVKWDLQRLVEALSGGPILQADLRRPAREDLTREERAAEEVLGR